MEYLLAFYIDSRTKNVWNYDAFRRIFHKQTIKDCESMCEEDIVLRLNECVTSQTISSALCRWYLLMDLENESLSIISDTSRENLKYQVMDENESAFDPYDEDIKDQVIGENASFYLSDSE